MEPQVKGYKQLDLQITGTLTTPLQIEIFGADMPQTEVYKPKVNNYHPLSASPIVIPMSEAVATTGQKWAQAIVVGGYDIFTDDTAPYVPTGTTKNFVYYDENGNLVYMAGVQSGSWAETDKVVVSSTATNYRHLMKVCEKAAFTLNFMRIKVNTNYLDQMQNSFQYEQVNVLKESVSSSFSPATYESEAQQQPNIVTMPVNQVITPKSSIAYTVNGTRVIGDGTSPANIISLSLFITPKTASMLSLL